MRLHIRTSAGLAHVDVTKDETIEVVIHRAVAAKKLDATKMDYYALMKRDINVQIDPTSTVDEAEVDDGERLELICWETRSE